MKPLLSIVVPTKDRYKYLKKLILLIECFDSNEIELVIQDNTENNTEILEFLRLKKKSFIKYAHVAEQIPISYNSDLAILNSSGRYICFIGDDDGVTSHIIDCVKWMDANDIEVCVPEDIKYMWPDYISSPYNNVTSTISYNRITNKVCSLNPMITLTEIMNQGFLNRGKLPLVYHGIVKRTNLDKIYSIGKTYFPGSSPDIANGVALCFTSEKYVRISFPIIISGACVNHGGGIQSMKNNIANIEDIPWLPADVVENWEERIPKMWTGETIWPESAIKALRYMGKKELVNKVNFDYMLAEFILKHRPYWKLGYNLSRNKIKMFGILMRKIVPELPFFLLRRLFKGYSFKKPNNGFVIEKNINDIIEANEYLMNKFPNFTIENTK